MPASRNSSARPNSDRVLPLVLALATLAGAGAVLYFYSRGWLLYYGDAQAHLNIARRVLDSRTPGWNQIGTVWLPLPHLLMLPLVRNDWLWRTGLAGSIPSSACFIAATLFLFAAARRAFSNAAAGFAAAGLFALNPNLLYLQSTAMTEPVFFAALAALVYFAGRFAGRPGYAAAAGAGLAALAGTLTRYEGWFLLPFAAVYFLLTGAQRRVPAALLFSALATAGPLFWLAHNWWYYGDCLEFYRGPYSARVIQGAAGYPGFHNWREAWLYFRTAAVLCMGGPLFWMAVAGAAAALWKRAFRPLFLLCLPPVFYLWSIHSSGTPIYVPPLWPHSYYNTRYGLALLPAAAFAAGALVAVAPKRWRPAAACAALALGAGPWLVAPHPGGWVTWKESEVNSQARRAWTAEAAGYLAPRYLRGSGILTTFGDMAGVFSTAGIPLRETLTGDNMPQWEAAVMRPDLFLWEEWAVAVQGDRVEAAIERAARSGPGFQRVKTITVKGAPAIQIYRRVKSRNASSLY